MDRPAPHQGDATVVAGPPPTLGPDNGPSSTEPRGIRSRGSGPNTGFVVDTGVGRLVAHWEESGAPSDLTDYLPDADAVRRAALVELIMVDLAYRWLRAHRPKRIADYCLEFPELLAAPLPPELVYEEYRVRRLSGEAVDPDEYDAEFPLQAERFEWLREHDPRSVGAGGLDLPGSEDLAVGHRLDDFDLVTELGHGAFARVFLARQRSMQRWVALKISRNVGTEAQTLAQLDHPYIVRVFDQRVLEDRQLRMLFMEYVPGGTLLDVLRLVRDTPPEHRSGRLLLDSIDGVLARKGEMRPADSGIRTEIAALSWPETVAWIGLRLAEALDYASDRGVLHRDIKPANVLLTVEGEPKLADFNVSSSAEVDVPGGGSVMAGSVAYMSPEQLAAVSAPEAAAVARIDTRSDIYALGVMLWELLTGSRPFVDARSGESPAVLLERRRRGVDDARQSSLPADCPAALRRVLLFSLAPDPADRWSSGRKLARQFALCLDPHARDLVDPPPASRRARMWRWALPVMIAAIGIPNLLAAGYNYYYNRELIVSGLSVPAQHYLEQVHLVIGALAFPLGALLILSWCRLALTVPRGVREGRSYGPVVLGRARAATLNMGHRAVVVSFALWMVAGIVYPIALQVAAGGIPLGAYTHLITSLVVCGAVAVAYPFFIVTYYAVRCLYPILLSHGEIRSDDGRDIRTLRLVSTRYLAVAASVPLVGVAGLSFVGAGPGSTVNMTVRVLCLGGILAFIGVYQLFRRIDSDLRALARVATFGVPSGAVPGHGRPRTSQQSPSSPPSMSGSGSSPP
ncbi:serine/threonine-protein kinase [Rhodococcus tukisamuensis]|uniref:Serine/threonine protein kinase n=1 Tax=Rhodococcus tukisamuensis TaxID=168276 RepID=A0A1G6VX97_9NOCA|nr:serine/threonine-protein kinase [Rhodococcus tukisamuensis]SDD58252.1 Serine/threonine protein kinase [Rhodococcus tukisamuensis]